MTTILIDTFLLHIAVRRCYTTSLRLWLSQTSWAVIILRQSFPLFYNVPLTVSTVSLMCVWVCSVETKSRTWSRWKKTRQLTPHTYALPLWLSGAPIAADKRRRLPWSYNQPTKLIHAVSFDVLLPISSWPHPHISAGRSQKPVLVCDTWLIARSVERAGLSDH